MKDIVSDVNDEGRIQEAFSLFDKDKSGEIEIEELGILISQERKRVLFKINLSSDTIMKQLGDELNCAQIKVELVIVFKIFWLDSTFRRW